VTASESGEKDGVNCGPLIVIGMGEARNHRIQLILLFDLIPAF
jgi:hypothetical protein